MARTVAILFVSSCVTLLSSLGCVSSSTVFRSTQFNATSSGVRVRVRANRSDVVLHQVTGRTTGRGVTGFTTNGTPIIGTVSTVGTRLLCRAPCQIRLPKGDYQFALSLGTRKPRVVDKIIRLDGAKELDLEYDDDSWIRITGYALVLLGGITASLGLLPLASEDEQDRNLGYIVMGVGGALVPIGLVFIFNKDDVDITARPWTHGS